MLGMIVRMDKSGLGVQSRRLCRMLKPDKIMLIDSTPFNGNEQYPKWYEGYQTMNIMGFPTDDQIREFVYDLTHVLTAESFYNNNFIRLARLLNTKTIQIYNYEFWDNLRNPFLEVADVLVQPSHWKFEEMRQYNSKYLPTPIFKDEFKQARETNLKRTGKPRYLFLNGKTAAHDRAGLDSLYEALQLSKGDYEVVVKAQGEVKKHPDPRLTYDFSNPEDQYKLYENFDAMIHPRRYGGQSLPMCEALMSGLPVIMPNISPNNKVLPIDWLVQADKTGEFMTRTIIDIYSSKPEDLAEKMDIWAITGTDLIKKNACKIAQQYEADSLSEQYMELII